MNLRISVDITAIASGNRSEIRAIAVLTSGSAGSDGKYRLLAVNGITADISECRGTAVTSSLVAVVAEITRAGADQCSHVSAACNTTGIKKRACGGN